VFEEHATGRGGEGFGLGTEVAKENINNLLKNLINPPNFHFVALILKTDLI